MHEQYRPASAPLVEPGQREPRSSVIAVLLGGLVVDTGGTLCLTIGIVAACMTLFYGVSTDPAENAESLATLYSLPSYRIALRVLGAVMSVVGGYTAAGWARRQPLQHGLGAGVMSLALGVLLALARGRTPDWLNALIPALGLLGGHLYSLRHRTR